MNKLLQGHAVLSLTAAFSNSPFYNLPLALYGLTLVSTSRTDDDGESLRNFSGLYGLSFLMDFFWLLQNSTNWLVWFLIVANFLLKPITLISVLGSLRERGQATFALPGSFNVPGMPGGFPPRQGGAGGETRES